MLTLKNYLLNTYAPSTAKAYEREILLYQNRVPGAEMVLIKRWLITWITCVNKTTNQVVLLEY